MKKCYSMALREHRLSALLVRVVVAALGLCGPTVGRAMIVEQDRPTSGKLHEPCVTFENAKYLSRSCRVVVNLSDAKSIPIPAKDWPKDEVRIGTAQNAGVDFDIPTTVVNKVTGKTIDVKDVLQLTQLQLPGQTPFRDVFPSSSLAIEAVSFDPGTSLYAVNNIFGALAGKVGYYIAVKIPDLFADVNDDRVIDDLDQVYAMVDLYAYLAAIPSFELGDSFNIVNGQVAGLAGMRFSITPFSFDPSTGFDEGTPFSGEGVTGAMHVITAVPTPTTAALAVIGLLVLMRRRLLRC